MTQVLLSLGANLGDRDGTLRRAIEAISERGLLEAIKVSSLVECPALGYTQQPDFLNLCVVGQTRFAAHDLRAELFLIENECGRLHREQWHERELDIDIVLFGAQVVHDDVLQIPHPRMSQRRFVLQPAAEIAASMLHPIENKTIAELLDECTDSSHLHMYPRSDAKLPETIDFDPNI